MLPRALRFKRPLHSLQCLQPNRDTKVELNHRSQACEGPGRHRYSRRVKWSERRVSRPLSLAPEASASLLGYALKKTPQRTAPGVRPLLRPCEVSAGLPGSTGESEMVEHQGIAPCIPVGKTGVYASTTMRERWSPVRELHPSVRFCRPLPGPLGQRDSR